MKPETLAKVRALLASEIECEIFETHVAPVLDRIDTSPERVEESAGARQVPIAYTNEQALLDIADSENPAFNLNAWKGPPWFKKAVPLYLHPAAAPKPAVNEPISDEQIRAVFLANGFTIKDGLSDLKPYVYAAARALLSVAAHKPQSVSDNESLPDDLRARGLTVAVHNDYRLAGKAYTFWLFTTPDGRAFKGEGRTDAEALNQVRAAIAKEAS